MSGRSPILFLCTGNSARSIMAEAIANQRFGDRLHAVSAGADPKPHPHPLALRTLAEAGLSTDGLCSKSWEPFADTPLDLVITVCGSAHERCPVFGGAAATVHWPLPDPPAARDQEAMFASVFAALESAIETLAAGAAGDLAGRAETAAKAIAQRFGERSAAIMAVMASPTTEPTTALEKADRVGDLAHRPRVLLGKMGLDGHDRGVKLIARAMRDSGIHVIYSGLWQTPRSLAISARDEDVDCIACSMMSNSHLVLVPRLVEQCRAVGRPDMVVNVGGIIPQEDVQSLIDAGVHRVYHTSTSMHDIVESVREATRPYTAPTSDEPAARLARHLSLAHAGRTPDDAPRRRPRQVVGMTGSPGAGKSTLVAAMAAEAVRRGERIAVVAFDPMSPITSGALLGDRLRVDFNAVDDKVFYRSLAIVGEDYSTLPDIVEIIGGAGYDTLIIETVGAGQNDVAIRSHVDRTAVVVVPGMGDAIQMEKAGILEIADVFVINKADFAGENRLKRELLEVAGPRPILETIATQGNGIVPLLDELFDF